MSREFELNIMEQVTDRSGGGSPQQKSEEEYIQFPGQEEGVAVERHTRRPKQQPKRPWATSRDLYEGLRFNDRKDS